MIDLQYKWHKSMGLSEIGVWRDVMKNIVLIFFSFIFLSGCIGTADYYASKTEYYIAQARAHEAYIHAVNKPLAEMTAPDGAKFIVNNHNIPTPRIEQANSPIVDGLKVILQSTPVAILSGGWAGKEIIRHSTGTLTTESGTINTNSGNESYQTDSGLIDQHQETSSISNDNHSATAPPLVVTQPTPVIVNQPSPLVVTQEKFWTEEL